MLAASRAELSALLGKGSEFEGKLAFEGTARIDGKVTGEITTPSLMIEKGAIFEGRSKMEEREPRVAAEAS